MIINLLIIIYHSTIIYGNYSCFNKHIYIYTLASILYLQYLFFYRAPLKKNTC